MQSPDEFEGLTIEDCGKVFFACTKDDIDDRRT